MNFRFTALLGFLVCLASQVPASAGNNASEVFVRAQKAVFDQASFRATTDALLDGKHETVIVEYLKPDRIHEKIGTHMEIIVVGKNSFMRGEGGAWKRSPVFANIAQEAKKTIAGQALLEGAVITPLGSENLNGTPTMTYRVSYKDNGIESITKYWIGTSDNLPRRAESTAKNIKYSTATFEYNINLKINPPI